MLARRGVQREAADGLAVDEDGAGGGVEQAWDEVDQGGFAGAGGAYDGEAGAGGDFEVDVLEDVGAFGVGEGEVAEGDCAGDLVRRWW